MCQLRPGEVGRVLGLVEESILNSGLPEEGAGLHERSVVFVVLNHTHLDLGVRIVTARGLGGPHPHHSVQIGTLEVLVTIFNQNRRKSSVHFFAGSHQHPGVQPVHVHDGKGLEQVVEE